MNDKGFIERLNLYLDDELSEEDSEALLQEIRENPDCHRIYVQYCQIHNACLELGYPFAEKPSRSNFRQKVYAISGMVAAVALLGLAAQNLSPILESGDLPSGGVAMNSEQSSSAVQEETLLVLDVNAFDSARFSVNSFDSGKAFNAAETSFIPLSDLQFVRFPLSDSEEELAPPWKKDFSFAKAITASTFEHETFMMRDEQANSFSQAFPSAIIEGEDGVRFDFSRAASFSTAARTAATSE